MPRRDTRRIKPSGPARGVVTQAFRRDVAAQSIRESEDLRVFAGAIARDCPDARCGDPSEQALSV